MLFSTSILVQFKSFSTYTCTVWAYNWLMQFCKYTNILSSNTYSDMNKKKRESRIIQNPQLSLNCVLCNSLREFKSLSKSVSALNQDL